MMSLAIFLGVAFSSMYVGVRYERVRAAREADANRARLNP